MDATGSQPAFAMDGHRLRAGAATGGATGVGQLATLDPPWTATLREHTRSSREGARNRDMSDSDIFDRINVLSNEEERLYESNSDGQRLSAAETERLSAIKVEPD